MKSSQVNFYIHPDDVKELEKFLAENDIVIINQPQYTTDLKFSDIIEKRTDNEWLKCFLARRQDIKSIKNEFINEQNYYLIDEFESPVIELRRCLFDGKILKGSRLYFIKAFYDSNDRLVDKPQDFINCAQSVLKWIKKHYNKDSKNGDYFSPKAEDWKNNNGEIALN